MSPDGVDDIHSLAMYLYHSGTNANRVKCVHGARAGRRSTVNGAQMFLMCSTFLPPETVESGEGRPPWRPALSVLPPEA